MSDRADGYTEYGFTAEFYDHVALQSLEFTCTKPEAKCPIPWRSLACPA